MLPLPVVKTVRLKRLGIKINALMIVFKIIKKN